MNGYNTNGMGGMFNVPPFVPPAQFNSYSPTEAIDDGPVWYVALAPLFSLVLGKFSGSKIAAIALWIFTYVLCVILCRRDYKQLEKFGYSKPSMLNMAFIPVVYLFVRVRLLHNYKMYGFVCAFSLVVALLNNNIITPISYDEDDYIQTVCSYNCREIEDLKDIDNIKDQTIQEAIIGYASASNLEWSCQKGEKISYITAKSSINYNGRISDLEIEFEMEYDGFSFDGIRIKDISIDGKSVSEATKEAMIMQIFSENDAADDNSSKYIEV